MGCDSIVSWGILLIFAIVGMVAVAKRAIEEEEARKEANRRDWEENGWGF